MIKNKLMFLFAILVFSTANVRAQNFWQGDVNSNFSLAGNWSLNVFPTSGVALMENGVPANVLTVPPSAMSELWLGTNGGTGTINHSNYSLTVGSWFIIGQGYTGNPLSTIPGGTGNVNLSGTAVLNHTGGSLHVGEGNVVGTPTTYGYLNLSGNAVLNNNNISDGYFRVGCQPTGNGTMIMSGNSIFNFLSNGGRFLVGDGGTGALTINNNATLNIMGWTNIGYAGGTGTVNMNGGTVNQISGPLLVGGYNAVSGTWYHNGGTLNVATDSLMLGDAGSGSSTTGNFHLNGGLVKTLSVRAGIEWDNGTATGNFYFNGGTLQALVDHANFMKASLGSGKTMNIWIQAGGAKIDSNGTQLRIPTALQADPSNPNGGLTKLGLGSLKLTEYSNYNGNTLVQAGTLILEPPNPATSMNTPTATVNAGAELAGAVTLNNVVVNAPSAGQRGSLTPGPMDGRINESSIGVMTMDNLNITAANLNYQIHTTSDSDKIVVSNNLNASVSGSDKNLFNFTQVNAGDTTAGTYPLITYATFTGNMSNFALIYDTLGAFDATLTNSAASINLVLSSPNEWRGPIGNNKYVTAGNWITGSVPNGVGRKAVFAGSGSGTGVVDLDSSCTLGKIAFSNSALSYTLSTTNSSVVNLDTYLLAGAQVVDNAGDHQIQVNLAMKRDTEFSVDQVGDTLTVSGTVSEIGGVRNLTKTGPGTLIFTQNATYTGDTNVLDGTLIAMDINTPNGDVLVASGTNPGDVALIASSIVCDTLTIGANSKIIIKPRVGFGGLSGGHLKTVPEPSTLLLLAIAALATFVTALRKRA